MAFTEELRCRELVALITEYLEGALSPTDRARFEQHLSRCETCERYLAEVRATLEVAGRLSEESLPPPARDALLHAFRDWARQPDG